MARHDQIASVGDWVFGAAVSLSAISGVLHRAVLMSSRQPWRAFLQPFMLTTKKDTVMGEEILHVTITGTVGAVTCNSGT